MYILLLYIVCSVNKIRPYGFVLLCFRRIYSISRRTSWHWHTVYTVCSSWFPEQRENNTDFDGFFAVRLDTLWNKQSRFPWFGCLTAHPASVWCLGGSVCFIYLHVPSSQLLYCYWDTFITVPYGNGIALKVVKTDYRKTCNISRTKSKNLNVSRLVSSCSCLRPIHWSQVSSREWRCSRSSVDRRCSNTSEWPTILWPTKVRFILEVWRYY